MKKYTFWIAQSIFTQPIPQCSAILKASEDWHIQLNIEKANTKTKGNWDRDTIVIVPFEVDEMLYSPNVCMTAQDHCVISNNDRNITINCRRTKGLTCRGQIRPTSCHNKGMCPLQAKQPLLGFRKEHIMPYKY